MFLRFFINCFLCLRVYIFVCTFVSSFTQTNVLLFVRFFISYFQYLHKCFDKHFFISCFVGLNISFVKYCYYGSYEKSPNFHTANICLFIRLFVSCFLYLCKYSFIRFFVSCLQIPFASLFLCLHISSKAQTKKSTKQQTSKATPERKFFKRIVYFVL